MHFFNIIAYIGGSILAAQMIPQIIKMNKNKSAKDISLFFLLFNIIGLTFMCSYGVHNNDKPLSITTGISLFNTIIVFILKIYYDYDNINMLTTDVI